MKTLRICLLTIFLILPLATQANAIFSIKFDEYGTNFVDDGNTGTFVRGEDGTMIYDSALNRNSLTFHLPDFVNPGDIGVYEYGSTTVLSDGLRFYSTGYGGFMRFYSSADGTAPADTGLPSNFSPSAYVTEDINGNFAYLIPSNNQYFGFSDTRLAVPEPGTMLLLGLGIAGLAGVRRFKK